MTKKYNHILSGNGVNREQLPISDVCVAIVSEKTTSESIQILSLKDAVALEKPMIGIIKKGIKMDPFVESIKWVHTIYWSDRDELSNIINSLETTLDELYDKGVLKKK